jgi:hypothetical protein
MPVTPWQLNRHKPNSDRQLLLFATLARPLCASLAVTACGQEARRQVVLHYHTFEMQSSALAAGTLAKEYTGRESGNRSGRRPERSNFKQVGPTLFQGEQIRANRLAAGSGLAKPGLETREPERRTCRGMGSMVSRILQCDYVLHLPELAAVGMLGFAR